MKSSVSASCLLCSLSLSAVGCSRPAGAPQAAQQVRAEPVESIPSNNTDAGIESSEPRADSTVALGRPFGHLELLPDSEQGSLLWIPAGSSKNMPLLAVAHGAGGSPEWHCDFWSRVVENRAFVLCLRGERMGAGSFYFPHHHRLNELFQAAHAAARQRYSDRLADTSNVFIGYSQGATMGSLVAADRAESFPYLLFLEGGHKYWSLAAAKKFSESGGKSVFFSCGTGSCKQGSEKAARWLQSVGVRVEVAVTQAGHTPAGEVGGRAIDGLSWLLQGSTRSQP